MCLQNRVISLLFRICIATIGIITLSLDLGIFEGEFKKASLLYFTNLSNLFCVIYFCLAIIKTVFDIKKSGIHGNSTFSTHLRGEILISILLTMTVYHFILIPYALKNNPYQMLKWDDIVLHYFIPVATFLDWILFSEKGKFKWYDPLIWTIGPIIYLSMIFIQATGENMIRINANIGRYVYAFLDIDLIGRSQVISNIIWLGVGFILIGYFIYMFDKIKISE